MSPQLLGAKIGAPSMQASPFVLALQNLRRARLSPPHGRLDASRSQSEQDPQLPPEPN
jgi:hypothetical protein